MSIARQFYEHHAAAREPAGSAHSALMASATDEQMRLLAAQARVATARH